MRNYRQKRNYENVEKCVFRGSGEFNIPVIHPADYEACEFIGFNYAKSTRNKEQKGVHFFIDDYQFQRLWTEINRYTEMLSKFRCVLSPDYSTYTDYPMALQIYNHYRKHWIAAYLQNYGVNIIPTISWSDKTSFKWCFDGEPRESTVAVSSVGVMGSKQAYKLFLDGYWKMLEVLQPTTIIFYGDIPKECKGNIVRIKTFQEKFSEVKTNGW